MAGISRRKAFCVLILSLLIPSVLLLPSPGPVHAQANIPNLRIVVLNSDGTYLTSASVAIEPSGGGTKKTIPAGVFVRFDPGSYRVVGVTAGGTFTAMDKAFTIPTYGQITVSVQLPAQAHLPSGGETSGPNGSNYQPPQSGGTSGDTGDNGLNPAGSGPTLAISADPLPVSGGVATFQVGLNDLAGAADMSGGEAVVDLSHRPEALNAPERQVQVDPAALAELIRAGHALRVEDRQVALTLPVENLSFLSTLAGGGELGVSLRNVNAQAAPVGDASMKAAGATVDVTVGRLAGGRVLPLGETLPRPLRLRFPYDRTAVAESEAAKLGIYYFEPSGGRWEYIGGKVDRDSGTVAAEVRHLSIYGLFVYDLEFSDLIKHWSRTDVKVLAARHVVKGTGPGRFDPQRTVTRAEFAAMVSRALSLSGRGKASFADVPASAWYRDVVAAAAAAGVVQGDGGKFRPLDPITRQEAALMLVRALGSSQAGAGNPALLGRFRDRSRIAPWAAAGVAAAVQTGLIYGRSAEEFAPAALTTRAEAAVLVKRLLSSLGKL